MEEIFIIRKVHISRLAVPGGAGLPLAIFPLRRFSSSISRSFMAFRPAGVAAMPRPRKFAMKFMEIDSYAG